MAKGKKHIRRKSPAGRPYNDSGRGVDPNNYPFSKGTPLEREAGEEYMPRAQHGVERRSPHLPTKGRKA